VIAVAERNMSPREREGVAVPDTRWMSLVFGPNAALKRELEAGEDKKIDLFEAGLTKELDCSDTINEAFTKIVRMALAAEFGISFVKAKGAKSMIDTIVSGIMGDKLLRRQALMIADRFSKPGK